MIDQGAVYPSLQGRSVFITGGGSGIGASLTREFARQKSRVVFVDIAEQASRELVESVQAQTGIRPEFMPCDLRDVSALQACIEAARRLHGDISVLVNNAASDDRHRIEDVSVDYWDERMAVNLRPMFFAAQAVAPQMQALGGGSIINFGSVSWRMAPPTCPCTRPRRPPRTASRAAWRATSGCTTSGSTPWCPAGS